ncbi:MAG: hypothetical protein JXA21_12425 [Anaerolineae bacterium]|nr:hypothetical protein [Anaerolineae bacterium]
MTKQFFSKLRTAIRANGRASVRISVSLLLFGALLVWLSFCNGYAAPATTTPELQSVTILPSPTWAHMPTRRVPPTPSSTPDPLTLPLQELRNALQSRDFEAAEEAWHKLYQLDSDGGLALREKARMALAQEEYLSAEAYAWQAIQLLPKDAETWALLGLILIRTHNPGAAEQALSIAQSLDPELAADLFLDRWCAARRAGNGIAMTELAYAFSEKQPDTPLAFYFRAAAFIASRDIESASVQLHSLLTSDGNAPAVLWYTLGETYMAQRAYSETITVMEVAKARLTQGDSSLYLASDDPYYDLNLAMARALLGSANPLNCTSAEPILRELSEQNQDLNPMIEQAILCQTPTPTMTPWLFSQIWTPTATRER